MSFFQYLKDTQGELRHVAWPTQLQTIVYTILVAFLSIAVALYLGLFDYLFTGGLARFLELLPVSDSTINIQETASGTSPLISESTDTPIDSSQDIPQLQ